MLSGIKDGSLLAEFDDSETKKETMQSFGVFSFNTAFLQKLENYDYTDYCDQFGSYPQIVKTGKGEVEVVHKDLAGTCCYSNTKEHDDIVNVKTDKPAKDGMPEIVRFRFDFAVVQKFLGKGKPCRTERNLQFQSSADHRRGTSLCGTLYRKPPDPC